MDEFNKYPWGSISFECMQDSLLFAPEKKESDEDNDGKGKGQKKGKKAVRSSVRKGKKNVEDEKRKRINRPAWNIKRLSCAFQIWAYELITELRIPPLRYCKRIEELVPRICRWESTDKVPEFTKLNTYIFQSKQHKYGMRHTDISAGTLVGSTKERVGHTIKIEGPIFYGVHLDQALHENPTKFDPWRWEDYKEMSKKVIVFGGGVRLYPGAELAKDDLHPVSSRTMPSPSHKTEDAGEESDKTEVE
ncbi:hypothetical protein L3X38_036762 [Prunus dulcis]|uniref:Uncharacterized protein n=1 Tax=Prunus dulcis TaxID=3755 RepID=A0AAD4V1U0_PRUDU|nr:hypothetical protein L3X38_036762 [Prunus dulcis]